MTLINKNEAKKNLYELKNITGYITENGFDKDLDDNYLYACNISGALD